MAFVNRIGNMLKQTVSKHINLELSASNSSLYLAIRSMSSSKVFVGGLSYGTDEPSLRDAFSQYGEVVEATVVMDRVSGRSRGFGFVTFTSSEEASSAINALDGKDLHGRQIRVNYATEKRQGFRGGYGGGGGGYAGPRGYGSGAYGGAGYGGSNNYSADGNYSGGGGYGSGNYGFDGGNYGSGSGGNYPSGNNSLGNSYSSGGSTGDVGFASGAGADYFSSGSTNQGGFATPESHGNASTSYGEAQEKLSSNQGELDAAVEDFDQENILAENYKDDNNERNSQANTRG